MGIDFNDAVDSSIKKSKEKQKNIISKKPVQNKKQKDIQTIFGINPEFAMSIAKTLPTKIKFLIFYAILSVLFSTSLLVYYSCRLFNYLDVRYTITAFICFIILVIILRIRNKSMYKRNNFKK